MGGETDLEENRDSLAVLNMEVECNVIGATSSIRSEDMDGWDQMFLPSSCFYK
jgi:hypothetical protein